MKTTIGIFENHTKAVEAIKHLHTEGFPVKQLSIIGRAETEHLDENLNVKETEPISVAGVTTGVTLGATVGLLTGVGLFAIPGLGFLYGAGALVGAIAGFDFGLIGAGIATFLSTIGIEEAHIQKYDRELKDGKYLIVAQGTLEETNHAKEVLSGFGTHIGIEVH